MPALADLIRTIFGPSEAARLLAAQERQAAALERLVQLAEMALQVDPATLAAAADAAAQPPGTYEIQEYKPAELQALEALITQLATQLGRIPTDEEVDAEIQRQAAADATAQAQAEYYASRGGLNGT